MEATFRQSVDGAAKISPAQRHAPLEFQRRDHARHFVDGRVGGNRGVDLQHFRQRAVGPGPHRPIPWASQPRLTL